MDFNGGVLVEDLDGAAFKTGMSLLDNLGTSPLLRMIGFGVGESEVCRWVLVGDNGISFDNEDDDILLVTIPGLFLSGKLLSELATIYNSLLSTPPPSFVTTISGVVNAVGGVTALSTPLTFEIIL